MSTILDVKKGRGWRKINDQYAHLNPQKAYRMRKQDAGLCVDGCVAVSEAGKLHCKSCGIKRRAKA